MSIIILSLISVAKLEKTDFWVFIEYAYKVFYLTSLYKFPP